jgi:hypothetical protein
MTEESAWFQLYELEMLRKLGKTIMNASLSLVKQVDTLHRLTQPLGLYLF